MTDLAAAPPTADSSAEHVALQLEGHRGELIAYCRRLLRCAAEAEDATQETLVRAWRNLDRFEGRASLRSWLYRIATNVCLDMLDRRRRTPLPLGATSTASADDLVAATSWSHPGQLMAAATAVRPDAIDPAEVVVSREAVRQAFATALQQLPARQRAVLILREVLRWQASEVAELLGTSVAAVNSALQRARATLGAAGDAGLAPAVTTGGGRRLDRAQHDLLTRYLDAFERGDVDTLVALLHADS
jgi:RNA polymerase sigma-70 factor, ECF subfamily